MPALADRYRAAYADGRAGCTAGIRVGGRVPQERPGFLGINAVLGNLKTRVKGIYHAYAFSQ